MIDLSKRIIEQSAGGKLAFSLGENVGWALYTDQQFFKGSFPANELSAAFFEKLRELRPKKISYQAVGKDDAIAMPQAQALAGYCKEKEIPLSGYTKRQIATSFLNPKIIYTATTLSGQAKEEATNRGWHCADSKAALALAVMECERNG